MGARERFVEAINIALKERSNPQERRYRDEIARLERELKNPHHPDKRGPRADELRRKLTGHQKQLIRLNNELIDVHRRKTEVLYGGWINGESFTAGEIARQAAVIRMSPEQLIALYGHVADPEADHTKWLKLPFKKICIVPSNPFEAPWWVTRDDLKAEQLEQHDSMRLVRLLIIDELDDPDEIKRYFDSMPEDYCREKDQYPIGDIVKFIRVYLHTPSNSWPHLAYPDTVGITRGGKLITEWGTREMSRKSVLAANWVIHLAYYLTSPSVNLVKRDPDPKLIKASRRRGKEPPQPWYEVEYTNSHYVQSAETDDDNLTRHVSYLFDVRGHFCT
jgi:hypothetical protein